MRVALLAYLAVLLLLAAGLQCVPLLVGARGALGWLVLLGAPLGGCWAFLRWRQRRGATALVLACLFLVSAGLVAAREARGAWLRQRVLGAPPAELRAAGIHFVVGYRDFEELSELAARGAIAGVYLTRRNLEGASRAEAAGCIAELQEMRRTAGLPALLIAADQEGGPIEHLSPPLPERPGLAELVARFGGDDEELLRAVAAHARDQALDLKSLGVTLNLAPVVDLRSEVRPRIDLYSRIRTRAIDGDAQRVAEIALAYCRGLAAQGLGCTLKHLPGLGRSTQDAHFFLASLGQSRDELLAEDLVPYARLARAPELPVVFMATHVVVPAVDAEEPASLSAPMLTDLVRRGLGFEGLLVSDDLSMLPIALGPGGVRRAACAGLAAGLDLLLLSYDPALYWEAMAALLDGCGERAPTSAQTAATSARLRRFLELTRSP